MDTVRHATLCSPYRLVLIVPILTIIVGFVVMPAYRDPDFAFSSTGVIIGSSLIALSWSFLQFMILRSIPVECNADKSGEETDRFNISINVGMTSVIAGGPGGGGEALGDPTQSDEDKAKTTARLVEIYEAIYEGAESFLRAEYKMCLLFVTLFAPVVWVMTSWGAGWDYARGTLTTIAFVLGAVTSLISGYLGMKVAVFSNVRTTVSAQRPGYEHCFNVAFRAGSVMGFALTGLGMLVMYVTLLAFRARYSDRNEWIYLTECITGYGLGGSVIAMFGRVGGGIYTKAADVGADLSGKLVHGMPEDDCRNPAVIADNVGDNVGDVAGMGSDLFGSLAESTCAALVLGANVGVEHGWEALTFPLAVSATGILVCLACSFLATHVFKVRTESQIELALKIQLLSTTILNVALTFATAHIFLPNEFDVMSIAGETDFVVLQPYMAAVCVSTGAVGGLAIGLVTEYYTSHSYRPVREVADSCKTGPATNMIYGLALGYKSTVIPVIILAIVTTGSFWLGDLYGVSLAAIGFLSNLATGLTIDVYGPVCDNAGGIAEMAELDPYVRAKTDALDAAGNTTAAIGKGFAIGSASLVSLALFGAFVSRIQYATDDKIFSEGVNILHPVTFGFLVIGGMIPFAFAAMTMKSVGLAAMDMVREVQRQFDEKPHLLDDEPSERPDYGACIDISTRASLKHMVLPGSMIVFTPLLTGIFFGVYAVSGLLVGSFVSSVQLAVSMSNSGGAWDNAKKYIEKQPPGSDLKGKGSEVHKAAVVGDTVGDPFKDTTGPALNIVMKLMAVLSLVFADAFYATNSGHGVFGLSDK